MKSVNTYKIRIYMAGSIEDAKRYLRRYCYQRGFYATVTPTTFIYTGGEEEGFIVREEEGFIVRLVNYPKSPMLPDAMSGRALQLAEALVFECCQRTALVVTPEQTYWIEIKPPGAPA